MTLSIIQACARVIIRRRTVATEMAENAADAAPSLILGTEGEETKIVETVLW